MSVAILATTRSLASHASRLALFFDEFRPSLTKIVATVRIGGVVLASALRFYAGGLLPSHLVRFTEFPSHYS